MFNGRPSGSAMPLMWAHAEYIKLLRSLRDGCVFDLPPQTVQRYLVDKIVARTIIWRFNQKSSYLPAGFKLRIELLNPAVILWTSDRWSTQHESPTKSTNLGVHFSDIPTDSLPSGTPVVFTFYWSSGKWEGTNFEVVVD